MIDNKKIIAIVPARAGSKGIKGKNLIKISGKPLVYYPINAALKSKYVDFVFCSTDSLEIAKISAKFGADVSILRKKKLSSDKAKSVDVLIDVIDFFEKRGKIFDYVVMIEPTSPLTQSFDIDDAIEKLHKGRKGFDSIISIASSISGHPHFTFCLSKSGRLRPFIKSKWKFLRRQDLKPYFFQTGSFYLSKITALKKNRSFISERTLGLEVPKWKSFEIDDYTDVIIIEALKKMENVYDEDSFK